MKNKKAVITFLFLGIISIIVGIFINKTNTYSNIIGDKPIANNINYNIFRYQGNSKNILNLIGNYIVETQKDKRNYKIMDFKGNMIYEGDFSDYHNFLSLDDNLLYYKNNKYTNINSNQSYDLDKNFYALSDINYVKYSKTYENNYTIMPYAIGFYKKLDNNKTIIKTIDSNDTKDITINSNIKTELAVFHSENRPNKNLILMESEYPTLQGIYNIEEQKWQINPKYSDIEWFTANKYIACQTTDNYQKKCGVIDELDNILIPFEYNHISIGDNKDYITLGKDFNYTFYDKDLNVIGILKKDNYAYYNGYKLKKLNDSYLIYSSGYGTKDYNKAYIFNLNGLIKELSYNDIFVRNEVIVLVDYVNHTLTGLDFSLNEIYKVTLPEIENTLFTSANQTVIEIDSHIYSLKDGKELNNDTPYMEVIDDKLKIYHKGLKSWIFMNNKKVPITETDLMVPIDIYETDNGYIIMSSNTVFSNFFTYLEKE